jgi:hypothetical protein
MSEASDPRNSEWWRDALIAARTVVEDARVLSVAEGDKLAEAVTERLLGHFLALAEADSEIVMRMNGTGPVCSWCWRLAGPKIPPGHPQYGVFCTCKRDELAEGIEAA